MSRPRSHFSTAFVAATFCVAATAGAQGRAEVSDSLLRRIHDLDSVMIARSRAVDSIRHSLVRSLPPVDVHCGALWVRTDSALAPRVRLAVDSVAALVERRGGTVLASRIASHVLVAILDSVRSPFGMRPTVTLLADTTRRWTVGRVQMPANPFDAAARRRSHGSGRATRDAGHRFVTRGMGDGRTRTVECSDSERKRRALH